MYKLLIIEDETDIRDSIVDIVRYNGYDYKTLDDGARVTTVALEYQPDLIICDILLPTVNGYDVIRELQDVPQTATIPFIFLTAKASYVDIRKGMDLGADDYLTKPFTAEQLIVAISNRLSRFETIANQPNEQNENFKDFLKMTLPHELRTPMSGIMGYLSLLTEGFDEFEPEQIRHMLNRMNSATKRLYHLIENYILYSQLTTSLNDPVLAEKLRESSYCLESADIIRHRAEQKALEYHRLDDLEINVADSLTAISPESLEKLVSELICNAFKFSSPGQKVKINSSIDEAGIYQLQIIDQGRGMNESQLKQIGALNQFGRRKFEQQGMGLGLAISQKLAEFANGQLQLQSMPEKGTTITISLPTLAEIPQFSNVTYSSPS